MAWESQLPLQATGSQRSLESTAAGSGCINSLTLFKYVSIYLSTCFIDTFIVAMCSEISYMFKRCPVLARQHGNSFRGKIEESRLCPELDSFRRQLWGDSSFTMPKALAPRHSDLCFASLRDQPLIAIYCHNKGSKDFGARDTGCHTLPRIPKNGPVRKTCWASQSFLVLEHLKPWQLVLNHKLQ